MKIKRNEINLVGKTVVITGASSGIGKACALAFAREGVNLVLAARRETLLQETASECESLGANAIAVKTDVSDRASVLNLKETALDFYENIDIWFNCAGVGAIGEFDEVPLDAHEKIIQTNLMGALYCSYFILPYFKDRLEGQIINMNSTGAFIGTPFAEAFSISQFGLHGLSESLQSELEQYPDIHISEVVSSYIDTTGIHHLANYKGKEMTMPENALDPFTVAAAIVKLAKHPKNSLHIGRSDRLARWGHAVFPKLAGKIMNKAGHVYFRRAKPVPQTDGNLFEPVFKGTEVRSGLYLVGND